MSENEKHIQDIIAGRKPREIWLDTSAIKAHIPHADVWPYEPPEDYRGRFERVLTVAELKPLLERAVEALGKPANLLRHLDHAFLEGSMASQMQSDCQEVIRQVAPVYYELGKILAAIREQT